MRYLVYFLYDFVQLTWGAFQSFIGFCLFLKFKRRGCKSEYYHGAVLTYHDGEWGGVSMGMFIFVNDHRSTYWIEDAITHEYGHTIQSLMLGPLYMWVIGVPSFVWCNSKKYIALRNTGVSYYVFYPEKYANSLGAKVLKRPIPTYSDEEAAAIRRANVATTGAEAQQ